MITTAALRALTCNVRNLTNPGINGFRASRKLVVAVILIAIAPPTSIAQTFDDVPTHHWAYSFIETLYANGITAGCGGGDYCPGAEVTRAQMAVFIERGIHGGDFIPPAATGTVFQDVGAGDFAASFIEQLFRDGITSGCGNGNFCPTATVTRAQMAVFLLRAMYGSGYSPPPTTGLFGDVPADHWAAAWIEQLAAEGITAGCGNGNYCPEDPVTRDQMAVFLVRTFGLSLPSTWYKDSDMDGYSDGTVVIGVDRPSGYYLAAELIATSGDCDDSNDSVHPGGTDIDADSLDQDCNGFEISGLPEVVFDWTSDRCEDLDVPDLPARAFRDMDNRLQLISSHSSARRFVGADLNDIARDCDIVMNSHRDPDPAMFNDVEWIGATYTEDGETIYAVVHNEYEGWTHPGQCNTPYWNAGCWYNGLTLAVSVDGGDSYQHPVAQPAHHIAGAPWQYAIGEGPLGIFHPSSILKRDDGYYYEMVHRVGGGTAGDRNQWTCLMRTSNLADPDAWRFWNGTDFQGRFVNPYTDAFTDPADHDCPSIDRDDISDMTQSLTFNEYLGKYVLVGSATSIDGTAHGFFISYSEDMIDWTPRELFLERALPWTAQDPNEPHYLYPSLLDPESTSRSFDTAGSTAYVYYTRNNRAPGDLDRDLLRIPLEFFRH